MTARAPTYRITVQGHLDEHWAHWLGDVILTHHDNGTSTLTAPVSDQAALHGLLAQVRDLGVPLVSVTPVADDTERPNPDKE
jgi:hypothetical protein